MKKILKVLFTTLFMVFSIFAINKLVANYSNDGLVFIVLSFTAFSLHLFAWIAPNTFFDLCWKITGILPDNFDYETSYSKLEIVDVGILITANIILGIGFLII
jgi:hypothetical protein